MWKNRLPPLESGTKFSGVVSGQNSVSVSSTQGHWRLPTVEPRLESPLLDFFFTIPFLLLTFPVLVSVALSENRRDISGTHSYTIDRDDHVLIDTTTITIPLSVVFHLSIAATSPQLIDLRIARYSVSCFSYIALSASCMATLERYPLNSSLCIRLSRLLTSSRKALVGSDS